MYSIDKLSEIVYERPSEDLGVRYHTSPRGAQGKMKSVVLAKDGILHIFGVEQTR